MTVKTQHEILGEQELRLACARKNRFFGPRDPVGQLPRANKLRQRASMCGGGRCPRTLWWPHV